MKQPIIAAGNALSEHPDGAPVYYALAKFVEVNKARLATPEWSGFSVLRRARFTSPPSQCYTSKNSSWGLQSTTLGQYTSFSGKFIIQHHNQT